MHVAPAPLGGSDEGRRRHRTSGVAAAEAEEEEDVRSCRRRSCQPEMSDHGCIHLNNFKAAKGIQPYKVIHAYFVTSTSTDARVRKVCSLIVFFFPSCNSRSRFSGPFALVPRRTSFSRSRSLLRSHSRSFPSPLSPRGTRAFLHLLLVLRHLAHHPGAIDAQAS